jgi:hypothetical protein
MPNTNPKKRVKSAEVKANSVKSAEVKAKVAQMAANKDKDVANYKANQETELKKGVTAKSAASATRLVSQGQAAMGGVAFNFLTGQANIKPFDKMFNYGGTSNQVIDTKTKKVVARSGASQVGTTTPQASRSYLNPKNALRMTKDDLYLQYAQDSINDRGSKEKQVAYFQNAMKRSRR